MEREAEILTWLNGRLVEPLVVIHKGKKHTVWTLEDGQGGMTIEDAVALFVKKHKINVAKEVAGE